MSESRVDPILGFQAVRNLLVDRITAEVSLAFAERGISSLVLKGPAIAQWLYTGDEVRAYFDSDLLVPRSDWDRAVTTLEELGFEDEQAAMGHPRMEGFASYAFARRGDHIDLHATLVGVDADFETVWRVLKAHSEPIIVAGTELPALDEPARLMHIALHAAHHHEGRPLLDLEYGLARCSREAWRQAADIARDLDALPFFAAGLALFPHGQRLATDLGVDDQISPEATLRVAGVPLAEGLHELAETPGIRAKVRLSLKETFPNPEFMRWWSPVARRGRRGLVASYVYRPIWLLANAPRAALQVRRARRAARSVR
jgi:hypothetical protein